MPISEVGHAKNVATLAELISIYTSWGAAYAPSNANISLGKLVNKLNDANTVMDDVTAVVADVKTSTNNRETLYKPLASTVSESVNYYKSTGATENNIDDAKGFLRKIRGVRATSVVVDNPATPANEAAVTHSAAQTSYIQRVEHFDGLIETYSNDPLYAPNEAKLTIATLQTYSQDLKDATDKVVADLTSQSSQRINRNKVLYADVSGLCDLASLSKAYAKSLWGASSPQNKQVSKLKFRKEDL